jgi:predicted signal transduction protein with EAL and GGDEF domain
VTESIFQHDPDAAIATLERILALGCTVSLDDFGTGHSSLDYLRKLQFASIKVDRGFVKGALAGNIESLATIRAVVAMAQGLEMGIVAEGWKPPRNWRSCAIWAVRGFRVIISGGPWIPRPSPASCAGKAADGQALAGEKGARDALPRAFFQFCEAIRPKPATAPRFRTRRGHRSRPAPFR